MGRGAQFVRRGGIVAQVTVAGVDPAVAVLAAVHHDSGAPVASEPRGRTQTGGAATDDGDISVDAHAAIIGGGSRRPDYPRRLPHRSTLNDFASRYESSGDGPATRLGERQCSRTNRSRRLLRDRSAAVAPTWLRTLRPASVRGAGEVGVVARQSRRALRPRAVPVAGVLVERLAAVQCHRTFDTTPGGCTL